MTGRVLVALCLLANVAAAFSVLGLGILGFTWRANAGVYPQSSMQRSEITDAVNTPQMEIQQALRALDRLGTVEPVTVAPPVAPKPKQAAAAAPMPRKPQLKPRSAVPEPELVPVSNPMIVPRPQPKARKPKAGTRPRIAVVIDDLGLNSRRTNRMIELDGPLTLAFLPYGFNLERLTSAAESNGHEIFLHLPMEPVGTENPGPNALLENLGPAEFERRMDWAFAQVGRIKGFNNHMGSRLTANPLAMQRVMAEARKRNLLFLDSKTSGRSVAYSTAEAFGVPAESRDIFLDHDMAAESVARQFGKVEKIARRRGQAIAIGHPYDSTYGVLSNWLKDAEERGFELVPVSVLIEEANAARIAASGGPAPGSHSGVNASLQRNSE